MKTLIPILIPIIFTGCSHAVTQRIPAEETQATNQVNPSLEWVSCIRKIGQNSSAIHLQFPFGNDGPFVAYGMELRDPEPPENGVFILSESAGYYAKNPFDVAGAAEVPAPIYETRLPDKSTLYFGIGFFDVMSGYKPDQLKPEQDALIELAKKRILFDYIEHTSESQFKSHGLKRPSYVTTMKNSVQTSINTLAKVGIKDPALYLTASPVNLTDPFVGKMMKKWMKAIFDGVPTQYNNILYNAYKKDDGTKVDPDTSPFTTSLESNECVKIENDDLQKSRQDALKQLSKDGITATKQRFGI